jgi:predicted enzyme related to lactoylglutathione lyase
LSGEGKRVKEKGPRFFVVSFSVVHAIDAEDGRVDGTASGEVFNDFLGEVVEYTGIVKMADAIDPDGNRITFVQDISGESEPG